MAERRDAMEQVTFRATGGMAGTAPAADLGLRGRELIGAAAARIMRKKDGPASSVAAQIPKTAGSPLPTDLRNRMEPKLGADLSGVKIHTGGESAEAATGFGARAFTHGNDVHFNAGEFSPGTRKGDQLIAHELTHVVQGQNGGVHRKADTDGEADGEQADLSQPHEPAEQEADAKGEEVAGSLHEDDKKEVEAKPGKAIAAKGPEIGRKVFLAEDPAKASIKRLGKSGQDQKELKDAIGKVAFERDAAIAILTEIKAQLTKFGLSKVRLVELTLRIDSTIKALQDHLTDADLTGAMRDTASDPVKQSGSGKTFNHLGEVQDTVRSMSATRTALVRLKEDLQSKRQYDPALLATTLNPPLDALAKTATAVQKAIASVKP